MKTEHRYYVYIVQCNDGMLYTGVTNNIERRLSEHNNGINPKCFTYRRRPVTLKFCTYFSYVNHAIAVEKQIKGWSRKKKEALINEHWNELQELSKSYKKKARKDPSTGLWVTP